LLIHSYIHLLVSDSKAHKHKHKGQTDRQTDRHNEYYKAEKQ